MEYFLKKVKKSGMKKCLTKSTRSYKILQVAKSFI